jgi:putative toxin-antitoxin system antitoxin component (TIGR02293 family)
VRTVIKERVIAGALGQVHDTLVAEPFEIVGHVESPDDVIGAVKRGLQVRVFDQLRSELDIPFPRLLQVVGMSDSTLRRRRTAGRLDQNESERVYRLGKLFHLAARVLGSRELAGQWFKMPTTALGGVTPLDYADTEIGKQEIEKLLYRIAYGIVS